MSYCSEEKIELEQKCSKRQNLDQQKVQTDTMNPRKIVKPSRFVIGPAVIKHTHISLAHSLSLRRGLETRHNGLQQNFAKISLRWRRMFLCRRSCVPAAALGIHTHPTITIRVDNATYCCICACCRYGTDLTLLFATQGSSPVLEAILTCAATGGVVQRTTPVVFGGRPTQYGAVQARHVVHIFCRSSITVYTDRRQLLACNHRDPGLVTVAFLVWCLQTPHRNNRRPHRSSTAPGVVWAHLPRAAAILDASH